MRTASELHVPEILREAGEKVKAFSSIFKFVLTIVCIIFRDFTSRKLLK